MSTCPDETILRSYHNGLLDDGEAEPVERHVASCNACREWLEALRTTDLSARIVRAAVQSGTVDAGESGPDETVGAISVADEAGAPAANAEQWDIPDYERVRLCGEGAYGSVWAVRDCVGVYRALKVIDLRPIRKANAGCRELTALEAYCRTVTPNDHLIQVYHVGIRGPLLYYAMELADNLADRSPVRARFPDDYRPFTLQHLIRRKRLHPDAAIEVALRLLRGLAHLHSIRLAHRDIKPANIVFVGRTPKLADIGMVTSPEDSPATVGTPEYMPPDRRMDFTADTYAMGKVLHEMLCGGFDAEVPELPEPVLSSTPHWDMEKVERCIARACGQQAEDRYASAGHMIEDLEACRLLPFEALLMDPGAPPAEARGVSQLRTNQIVVAAIRALPWMLGLILAIMIVGRLW